MQFIFSYSINEDPEKLKKLSANLSDNFMMIGTGRHEFYKNLQAVYSGLTADQLEVQNIHFDTDRFRRESF